MRLYTGTIQRSFKRRLVWPTLTESNEPQSTWGTLARGKGECEKGGLAAGSDGAHVGFDNGMPPSKPARAALPDLRGGIGIGFQHADHLALNGSSLLVRARGFPAPPEARLGEPVGDSTRIEGQGGGNLRVLSLCCSWRCLICKNSVIDHDNSQICLNTALRSTGSSSLDRAGAQAAGLRASRSRAKTW